MKERFTPSSGMIEFLVGHEDFKVADAAPWLTTMVACNINAPAEVATQLAEQGLNMEPRVWKLGHDFGGDVLNLFNTKETIFVRTGVPLDCPPLLSTTVGESSQWKAAKGHVRKILKVELDRRSK
jgi:hypothetical protein